MSEETKSKDDMVNHPSHYNKGGVEVIDIIKAHTSSEEFSGFLFGNVIKYVLRSPFKGDPITDLKKSKWYLEKMIAHEEKRSEEMLSDIKINLLNKISTNLSGEDNI